MRILDFSRPGKPTDNAFIESFNGRLRRECLNRTSFIPLADARAIIEAWRQDYNQGRPHSSVGQQSPDEFMIRWQEDQVAQKHTIGRCPGVYQSGEIQVCASAAGPGTAL